MTNTTLANGHCLCGAVTLIAKIVKQLDACHCDMCKHWSGGPLLSVEAVGTPQFKGEEHIAVYHSSDWAERAFCKCCGSHLFYKLIGEQGYYDLPIGLFDELQDIHFATQIYIDKKPTYYTFVNETKNMTEAEIVDLCLLKS